MLKVEKKKLLQKFFTHKVPPTIEWEKRKESIMILPKMGGSWSWVCNHNGLRSHWNGIVLVGKADVYTCTPIYQNLKRKNSCKHFFAFYSFCVSLFTLFNVPLIVDSKNAITYVFIFSLTPPPKSILVKMTHGRSLKFPHTHKGKKGKKNSKIHCVRYDF